MTSSERRTGEMESPPCDGESGRMDGKICGVCGDKALGYNFNAVTCESCKAFFRRNALKNKEFRCPFSNNCKVDVVTRRFCQKCRLKKCFDIGMKKEWIMTEEERKLKKQKIAENRAKRQQEKPAADCPTPDKVSRLDQENNSDNSYCSLPDDPVEVKSELKAPTYYTGSPASTAESPLSSLGHPASPTSEIANETTPIPSPSSCITSIPSSLASPALPDNAANPEVAETAPLPLDTVDSILTVAIKAEFGSYGLMRNLSAPSRDLNEAEQAKIQELVVANKALLVPVDEEGHIKETSDPTLLNVINLTDVAIRRLIKMAKKVNGFKNLCQEDQIALLKGGCTELMILRSVMTYDPDKDVWKVPHSHKRFRDIRLDVLKEARGNLYEEHQRFIRSFQPHLRADQNVMLILGAITLFTPERPNIIHPDVIKLEQDSYYYLLRRYLESMYAGCEARSTYLQLIRRIAELHILNENHVRVFLDVNPRDVEPLLIEIFDLKNH